MYFLKPLGIELVYLELMVLALLGATNDPSPSLRWNNGFPTFMVVNFLIIKYLEKFTRSCFVYLSLAVISTT